MLMQRSWLAALLLLLTVTVFMGCEKDDPEPQNIAEYVSDNGDFSLLLEALQKTGLDAALANETAKFTVFAPTNTAFQAFLTANGIASVAAAPTPVLEAVLRNHVLADEVTSTELTTGYYSTIGNFAANEPIFLFVNTSGGVKINGTVNVTKADEQTTNGVIHVIDAVIAPATVVTFAASDPSFSSLVAALTRPDLTADFVATLSGAGPFTVFAPTNAAFQALLASNPAWNSLNDIPVAVLEKVLTYHVVNGANVRAGDLSNGQQVTTLSGDTFQINLGGAQPRIIAAGNTANIVLTDVQAANGVVHVVDAVLLPPL